VSQNACGLEGAVTNCGQAVTVGPIAVVVETTVVVVETTVVEVVVEGATVVGVRAPSRAALLLHELSNPIASAAGRSTSGRSFAPRWRPKRRESQRSSSSD
jgi:tRNA A37 threonylcarbamoyladenosine synthetase subunit TsaC/SUA5/YrdC